MGTNHTENSMTGAPDRRPAHPSLDEAEARQWGAALHIADVLRPADALRDQHASLSELRTLAEARRRNPGEMDIPGHLAVCPVCLDLFQALLEGEADVSQDALTRFENTPGAPSRRTVSWWRSSKPAFWSIAAIVALLLGSGFLYQASQARQSPVTVQGLVTLAGGAPVAAGIAMPAGEPVTMEQGALLALDDGGTSLRADVESTLSFERTWRGNPLFVMQGGDVFIKAAKQKPGSSIVVRTALGDIRVVGTEFRVTLQSEQVEVHESRPGQAGVTNYSGHISAVVVAVREGTVAVRNRHNQVLVPAGGTAILREDQPWIEVR